MANDSNSRETGNISPRDINNKSPIVNDLRATYDEDGKANHHNDKNRSGNSNKTAALSDPREEVYTPSPSADLVGDCLCVAALFLVYFCMAASNRVFGILLIALRERFPDASITALSSLSGVVSALQFCAAPFFSILMNKGATPRMILCVAGVVCAGGAIASAYATSLPLLYFT